ncbi:MAG: hypothetical protein ACFNKE_07675, partial [Neisseria elongata]
FKPSNHPANLSMALGAGSSTPLQMAEAYAVFANVWRNISGRIIRYWYGTASSTWARNRRSG